MKTSILLAAVLLLPGAALAQAPAAAPATTGTVLEQSSEYRFQLDMHVNEAALAKFLPAGWESAVATQGAAKDCNLRLIFIDRLNIQGPDNRVLPPGKDIAVYLEAPVKQSGGTATGRMVLGGIAGNTDLAAGTFGKLEKAVAFSTTRNIATAEHTTTVSEEWDLAGVDDSMRIQLHVRYKRGAANHAVSDVRFYDPADPTKSMLAHTEQETDITRNVTTMPPDRVEFFFYDVNNGKFASLFDGTQKALSWDSQPTYRRTIVTP